MPTEFTCVVDTDGTAGSGGVDFTSLAAWWAVLRGAGGTGTLNLDSVDPWVVPGTLSGTIAPGTPVTQAVTGAVGTLVHHNQAGQALIKSNTANPILNLDDTNAWYPTADGTPGSNRWTPTGPHDMTIPRANCRGTAADTAPVVLDGVGGPLAWTSRILIVGDYDPKSPGGWDASKYRLQGSVVGNGMLAFGTVAVCVELRNMQVWNTSADITSDLTSAVRSRAGALFADRCLFRGGRNTVVTSGSVTKHVLRNTACFGASKAALYNTTTSTTPAAAIVQNGTLAGGTHGLLTDPTAHSLAQDTYASGTTAAFSGPAYLDQCGSNDGTAAAGTGLIVSGTPQASVPADATTFYDPSIGDFRPRPATAPAVNPLAYAGTDLAANRTRWHPNTAGAAHYSPVRKIIGILGLTAGSAVATYRQYEAGSDTWYDGVQRSPDMGLTITLPHASTTGDWIVLMSDIHCWPAAGSSASGYSVKNSSFPAIDALNAGTKGGGICAGKLKHLIINGDLIDQTPASNYGPGTNTYQDIFTTLASIPTANIWHTTGNHDELNAANGGSGGFEDYRFNRTNTTATLYTSPGGPATDEDKIAFDIGNNRFVLVPTSINYTLQANDINNTWFRTALQDAVDAGKNLFIINHAPRFATTRSSTSHWGHDPKTICLIHLLPWAVWHSGHTHFAQYNSVGIDAACTLTEADYPTGRLAWDIGAGESPPLGPRRPVRAAGRTLRGIRI